MSLICYGFRLLESKDFIKVDDCFIDKLIYSDFCKLKNELAKFGFKLHIESGYRNFEKQLSIWNKKANGQLPLLAADGTLMQKPKDEESLMRAILTWSALPGASRHHLGTDLDVIDSSACPNNYKVELTPAECDGMFAKFHEKLSQLILENNSFGFSRVFIKNRGKIQPEKWHIAHIAVSRMYLKEFSLSTLRHIYENIDIACKQALLDNLDKLADDYIYPYFI